MLRSKDGTTMSPKRAGLIGGLALVLLLGVLVQIDRGAATPQPGEPATDEQVKMFEDLLRQHERVMFDALVTGDVTRFATIYYNDPTVELNAEFHANLTRAGSRAPQAVARLEGGPKGHETGYLTAQVAGIINRQENVAAWEAAQAKAQAEGRQPSTDDMPNGAVPYEPKTADQWIDVPFYVYDVLVRGNHATATLSYGPPEDADSAYIFHFTMVEDRWYISGSSGGHVTSPIKPKTTPYVTLSADD
jgi:hypothetical protein